MNNTPLHSDEKLPFDEQLTFGEQLSFDELLPIEEPLPSDESLLSAGDEHDGKIIIDECKDISVYEDKSWWTKKTEKGFVFITDGRTCAVTDIYPDGDPEFSIKSTHTLEIPAVLDGKPVRAIGELSFSTYPRPDIYDEITSIVIPEGVIEIERYAFSCLSNVRSLVLPDSILFIDKGAFADMENILNITLGKNNPVYHCTNNCLIETATKTLIYGGKFRDIPTDGSVTSIGAYAYVDCRGVRRLHIPDFITSVGSWSFKNCRNVTDLYIPDGLIPESHSFYDTLERVESINVGKNNRVYHADGNCLIETASKKLILGCNNSRIPADGSVETILHMAFYRCMGLKEIDVPESVTEIGQAAFFQCVSLRSVRLHAGLKLINNRAFCKCRSLSEIILPDGLTFIGTKAFMYCKNIREIRIPASVTLMEKNVFDSETNLITEPGSYAEEWNRAR